MENELLKKLKKFEDCAIGLATGKGVTYEAYESERSDILSEPELVPYLPEWIVKNRYGGQFWYFIKAKSPTYQGRREFIWNSIGELSDFIKSGGSKPTAISMNSVLKDCNSKLIEETWKKIYVRRGNDIEGAITSARALVESTCKYILDQLGEVYADKEDLSKLYKKVAAKLRLSPHQHKEQIFKQILSGCSSAIEGFASLRNAYGDAHGKGKKYSSPELRHADLAINFAGSISAFLIATFEERKTEKSLESSE